jgi:hypothetical protein
VTYRTNTVFLQLGQSSLVFNWILNWQSLISLVWLFGRLVDKFFQISQKLFYSFEFCVMQDGWIDLLFNWLILFIVALIMRLRNFLKNRQPMITFRIKIKIVGTGADVRFLYMFLFWWVPLVQLHDGSAHFDFILYLLQSWRNYLWIEFERLLLFLCCRCNEIEEQLVIWRLLFFINLGT